MFANAHGAASHSMGVMKASAVLGGGKASVAQAAILSAPGGAATSQAHAMQRAPSGYQGQQDRVVMQKHHADIHHLQHCPSQ